MNDAPTTVLYRADPVRGATWREIFAAEAPELRLRIWPDLGPPGEIEYLVAWEAPRELLASLTALRALISTGAGIDQFELDGVPPQVQVLRMIEPGITEGVLEHGVLAVLAAHRRWLDYRNQQQAAEWRAHPLVPAARRRVGVLGLGVLGRGLLARLAPFGFELSAWSRTPQSLPGVDCHAGLAALDGFIARCNILVCLLPLTPATRGLLDGARLARLPRGATLVNMARGAIVDTDALRTALDTGSLDGAMLDVTDPEPLPPDHPLWRHPRVLITPHVAGMTRPDTAARVLIDMLRRLRRGERPPGMVDRSRGY